jgi:hypothetical protein
MDEKEISSSLEQTETIVSEFAIILGTYYKDLIENRIPYELACQLVQDYALQWWEHNMDNGTGLL